MDTTKPICPAAGSKAPASDRVLMILDTDLQMDVDDVGALAVCDGLTRIGAIDVLAVMVNTPSVWGPLAANVVSTSLGRAWRIGRTRLIDNRVAEKDYAKLLATRFGALNRPHFADSIRLYRELLTFSEPASITIVSIGFFPNLIGLLDSGPDEVSPLSGRALVERSVKATFVMGGIYPEGPEFNFLGDAVLTDRFLREWPSEMSFVGFECGDGLISGRELSSTLGEHHPVAVAYREYNRGESGRDSWDPLTVLAAANAERFSWSPPGVVEVDSAGHCKFIVHPGGNHRVMLPPADPTGVAAELDFLMTTSAGPFGEP